LWGVACLTCMQNVGTLRMLGECSIRCHLEMYVVTWNAILGRCSMHGHARDTLEQMCEKGVQPNDITFVCLM
jgi:pentatricopeptide repeat protein